MPRIPECNEDGFGIYASEYASDTSSEGLNYIWEVAYSQENKRRQNSFLP